MKRRKLKKALAVSLGALLLSNTLAANLTIAASSAPAAAGPGTELPAAPVWGHFVDSYTNNSSVNLAVYSNPAIGVLSGFLELWKPGTSWNNGTKLNSEVLDANIQYVVDLAKTRTQADEDAAYLTDRRNQTYGATEGLGPLAEVYRTKSKTTTSIKDIPADAVSKKYDDTNGANKGGDSGSELGKMVDLIGIVRGNAMSTNPAKAFYNYKRPFRWAEDTSVVIPTLRPAIKEDASSDGGFPSGHTNASYLAAYALAYAVPERFQELMTRASEMGDSRIVAGMHSPLDVIGGRVMSTALAAAALADPQNAELKQAAYDQAHALLLTETGTAEDKYSNYEQNKADYTKRLTYGFAPIHSTLEAAVVPKGAEVLLETRQPYLSAEQRRAVLATTAISSGYPVLDDPEGWGRLNLFAAADGYGALNGEVTVTMDASEGGFYALDSWKNNISGTGKLTKAGSGTLKLTGSNMYAGGTEVAGGTLEGASANALGSGDVTTSRGSLVENVTGPLNVGGDYTQAAAGTLALNIAGAADVVDVKGDVKLDGALQVKFTNSFVPGERTVLIRHDGKRSGEFTALKAEGLPGDYSAKLVYEANQVVLVAVKGGTVVPTTAPTASPTASPTPAPTAAPTNAPASGGGAVPTQAPAVTATPSPTAIPAATPTPTATPVAEADHFQSAVTSRDAVLKALGAAAAATGSGNTAFKDTASHWGSSTIAKAVKLGIINGYEDNSFKPDAPVTRAEFAAMIGRAFGLTPVTAAGFKDTGTNWAAGYIGALTDKGIVTGYADGSFKPNAKISRAEMVAIIARVLDLDALASGSSAGFKDVGSDNWAAEAIGKASAAGLVQGLAGSAFAPGGNATRAESVTLIIRALESDSTVKAFIEQL
ncbi:S-layer homology domain-containing protein [Paenibacillus sp. MMS20-IR301]|uniref:S-layer homology domain-containing protein n=1 Tax=Paenibacillus sp. MMS20-IR301 TaxID=2895946 RepID=UPI0028E203D1|nr:S-layer homology domain-containing protein [Paenibacillus sp. MMS20-IR301]WNS43166.1 S-layer homology domain-containing protein [Paenibacillus sp. MMS20-IR301]